MARLKSWVIRNVLLPAGLLPTRSRYASLARKIENRQFWGRERMESFQLKRLRALLAVAAMDSPFYKDRFREFGLDSGLTDGLANYSQFPVTTKQDIENHFPDGMTNSALRTKDWQYVGTRGTTRRVMVIHDFNKRDAGRASELVAMTCDVPFGLGDRQVAVPPDACSTHCGIEGQRADRVRDHLADLSSGKKAFNREFVSDLRGIIMNRWILRYKSLPPLPVDADEESLAFYVRFLRKSKPKQLFALPEYLMALANYILESGNHPEPIRVLRPMGANMPAAWRTTVEEAFRGTVREHYGTREMGIMAFDCQARCGLHVMMDQFLIEIVDSSGMPVRDGDLGQILITDLQNFAMPILRYRIGDLARIERFPCQCGRQTIRLHLEGRVEDAIVLDSGRVITAEEVSNFLYLKHKIDRFELAESDLGGLQLRFVRPPNFNPDDASVGVDLSAALGVSTVRSRSTPVIHPEASGKFRHCKSQSHQQLGTLTGRNNSLELK